MSLPSGGYCEPPEQKPQADEIPAQLKGRIDRCVFDWLRAQNAALERGLLAARSEIADLHADAAALSGRVAALENGCGGSIAVPEHLSAPDQDEHGPLPEGGA